MEPSYISVLGALALQQGNSCWVLNVRVAGDWTQLQSSSVLAGSVSSSISSSMAPLSISELAILGFERENWRQSNIIALAMVADKCLVSSNISPSTAQVLHNPELALTLSESKMSFWLSTTWGFICTHTRSTECENWRQMNPFRHFH